jgi:hypothetical protein
LRSLTQMWLGTPRLYLFLCYYYYYYYFCITGAWSQGLHLEPLQQPFFVMGFLQIGARELFAQAGLELQFSWILSLSTLRLQNSELSSVLVGWSLGRISPMFGISSLCCSKLWLLLVAREQNLQGPSLCLHPLPLLRSTTIEQLKWQFGNVLYCENSMPFVSGI